MPLQTLLLCTHNKGKQKEISDLLKKTSINILTSQDFPDLPNPEETGQSFYENAQIKAHSAWQHTGQPSLADDSGLVIDALQGEPGIYSGRYAGIEGIHQDQANRDLLIKKLQSKPHPWYATFVCNLVLQMNEEQQVHFQGKVEGCIVNSEKGQNGFGYDSIFYYPPKKATFAELSPEEKNKISHRANALKNFKKWVSTQLL